MVGCKDLTEYEGKSSQCSKNNFKRSLESLKNYCSRPLQKQERHEEWFNFTDYCIELLKIIQLLGHQHPVALQFSMAAVFRAMSQRTLQPKENSNQLQNIVNQRLVETKNSAERQDQTCIFQVVRKRNPAITDVHNMINNKQKTQEFIQGQTEN